MNNNDQEAFSNQLTPAELERLALLSEELGEAQQIIGKIIRHGYESYDPTMMVPPGESVITNRTMLEKELGDVSASINIMNMAGDVTAESIQRFSIAKMRSVNRWLHHFKIAIPQDN